MFLHYSLSFVYSTLTLFLVMEPYILFSKAIFSSVIEPQYKLYIMMQNTNNNNYINLITMTTATVITIINLVCNVTRLEI